jgi:uncharacterized flavoprotein (TIGR03862 family)
MPDALPTPSTVAVVGGGPAGLMAAEVLAGRGVAVTIYERMPTVGRKLQVAGRGGLNLTHPEPLANLLDRYGPARARLAPAIERFDPSDLRAWAEGLGQGTFVGSSGRVFPLGLRATTLLRAWLGRLAALGVEVRTRHTWLGWDDEGALRFQRSGEDPMVVAADACVLALGGASWPRTGSDGAWVSAVRRAGVDVTPLLPSNCGFDVAWTDVFRERFAGAPVKDVRLRHAGQTARGDLVITDDGLEGGPVYALAPALRGAIASQGSTVLQIDLMPDADAAAVEARLGRRRARDSTATGLRRAGLAPVAIALLRESTANDVPSDARALASLVKRLPIRLVATRPIERAISAAGGIALDELDERWMLRRRPGTFVAGEMLDWEAPTGGYLLQASFSTGVAAAEGALSWLADRSH